MRNVWKKYGSVEAVKGISFDCKNGELLSVLGPSGCGKTSTLRMLAGLEDITGGEVLFDGKVVNQLTPKERDVAMAFEDYALYPALSVFDNIAFPLRAPHRAAGYTEEQVRKKVGELAEMLDLTSILDHRVRKLSGGQQQRISLARALVRPASAYVLDEPLSHLDGRQQLEVRASLRRMQQIEKTTVLLVTHNQAEAISMADRIILMNMGEIEQIGTPGEIWNEPASLFVAQFIGDPPMNFIPARFDKASKVFKAEKFSIEAVKEIQEAANTFPDDEEFIVGIRPDDFDLSKEEKPGHYLSGNVWIVEPMGDETIITVSIAAGTRLKALVPGDFIAEVGERMWLGPNLESVHIFRNRTGKSLHNSNGSAQRHY